MPSLFHPRTAVASLLALACCSVLAHGDVTPQAVDTTGLAPLGEQWRSENPFRGDATAVRIGTSAYNQNCARCHGLEAISGGIAPDLRKLDNDCAPLKDEKKKAACVQEIDEYVATTVRRGRVRNGAVYMPPFEGVLNQEAVWAIKSYLESRRERPL
ncbi:MAG: cytochrome c-550 PedF [Vitreoscilla sp.]|nr:cytochrome c-550 PedF [Vitreoscilla sp.]